MATQPQSVIPMVRPMDIQEVALPKELQDKLKEPLPPEAITANDKTPHLSSIKPAFVIERMNDVFGIGGYHTTNKTIHYEKVERTFKKGQPGEYKRDQFIGTVHGTLDIPKYGIHLENFGGSENDDLGDALKGAATDAFTKMCSYLGIGLDVYKGKHDKPRESEYPPCPKCGKMLRKSKDKDELYCWKAKEGCGATFTPDELKAAIAAKNKPPQSTQQPRQQQRQQPQPNNVEKITISAIVTEKRIEDRREQKLDSILWLQVGKYKCASKTPEIWTALNKVKVGSTVTLMVSKLSGQASDIYLIHKVIPNAPEGGRA